MFSNPCNIIFENAVFAIFFHTQAQLSSKREILSILYINKNRVHQSFICKWNFETSQGINYLITAIIFLTQIKTQGAKQLKPPYIIT